MKGEEVASTFRGCPPTGPRGCHWLHKDGGDKRWCRDRGGWTRHLQRAFFVTAMTCSAAE